MNSNFFLKQEVIVKDEYHILSLIGQSGFSFVYLAEHLPDGGNVVLKELFNEEYMERLISDNTVYIINSSYQCRYEDDLKRFLNEWGCMNRFKEYLGMVTPIDFFYENNTAYIVMEHLQGGNLKDNVLHGICYDEDTFINKMDSVLELLDEMHRQGYLHGDISPDNLLMDINGNYKLIDFGAIRPIGSSRLNDRVLYKEHYTPYEALSQKDIAAPQRDIYSLCAVFYYALTGLTPPDASDEKYWEATFSTETKMIGLDPIIKNLIEKGLSMNPSDRWSSIGEIREQIKRFRQSNEGRQESERGALTTRQRKKVLLVTFGVIGLYLLSLLLSHIQNKESRIFRGEDTQKLVFYHDKEMSSEDLETLIKNTKEKFNHIAGDKYLIEKYEDYFEVTTSYALFNNIDISSTINKYFNFRNMALYTDINEDSKLISNISSNEIEKVIEQEDGIVIIPDEVLLDKIILFSESNDSCFNLIIRTNGLSNQMWDFENTPEKGDSYYIETIYNKESGCLYISDMSLGGIVARKLFIDCIFQRNVPVTSFNYSRHIIWENKRKSSWGKNQVRNNQFSGETVLLDYRWDKNFKAEQYQNIFKNESYTSKSMDLKDSLDSLKIPYACGWDASNEQEIYIKVNSNRVWEIEAMLLFMKPSFEVKTLSGITLMSESEAPFYKDNKISFWSLETTANYDELKESLHRLGNQDVQFCVNEHPIFQAKQIELDDSDLTIKRVNLTDCSLLTNHSLFIDEQRINVFFDYLNELDGYHYNDWVGVYNFSGAFFYDSYGEPIWNKTVWDLSGCQKRSLSDEITKLFSKKGISVSYFGSMRTVLIPINYNKVLSQGSQYVHPFAIVEEMLKSIQLTNEINDIIFCIIDYEDYDIRYLAKINKNSITGNTELYWQIDLVDNYDNQEDVQAATHFLSSKREAACQYFSSSKEISSCFLYPAVENMYEKTVVENTDLLLKACIKNTLPGQNYQIEIKADNKSPLEISVTIDRVCINNMSAELSYNTYNVLPIDYEDLLKQCIDDVLSEGKVHPFSHENFNVEISELSLSSPTLPPLLNAYIELTIDYGDKKETIDVQLPNTRTIMEDIHNVEYPNNAELLLNENEYAIYINKLENWNWLYTEACFILVNKTNTNLSYTFDKLGFNDNWSDTFNPINVDVPPYAVKTYTLKYTDSDMYDSGIYNDSQLESISISFRITNTENAEVLLKEKSLKVLRKTS